MSQILKTPPLAQHHQNIKHKQYLKPKTLYYPKITKFHDIYVCLPTYDPRQPRRRRRAIGGFLGDGPEPLRHRALPPRRVSLVDGVTLERFSVPILPNTA